MGLRVTGYDLSREALEFARLRLEREGLGELVALHLGDMAGFRCDDVFDGAFNAINSFRYLLDDDEIRSCLQALELGDVLLPSQFRATILVFGSRS